MRKVNIFLIALYVSQQPREATPARAIFPKLDQGVRLSYDNTDPGSREDGSLFDESNCPVPGEALTDRSTDFRHKSHRSVDLICKIRVKRSYRYDLASYYAEKTWNCNIHNKIDRRSTRFLHELQRFVDGFARFAETDRAGLIGLMLRQEKMDFRCNEIYHRSVHFQH